MHNINFIKCLIFKISNVKRNTQFLIGFLNGIKKKDYRKAIIHHVLWMIELNILKTINIHTYDTLLLRFIISLILINTMIHNSQY